MNRCHLRAPRRSLAAVIAVAAVLAITGVLAFAFVVIPLARAVNDTPADLVHAYQGYWNGVDQQMTQITQARQQDGRTP